MDDVDDYDPAYGNRTSSCSGLPMVATPADPRGGGHNPAFSMIRTIDNGAVFHSDGTFDQQTLS